MNNEKDRLLELYKQGKITEDDFKLLSKALTKKNPIANKIFTILINPFQKIAGAKALMIGIVILLGISYFGTIANIYFTGTFGLINAIAIKKENLHPNFILLLYQNIIPCAVLSLLFFLSAIIFRQKRIRFIDILGTVTMARFPLFFLTLFIAVLQWINPEIMNIDITKGLQLRPSFTMILFGFIVTLSIIWQVMTYFYALKISSGLTTTKLWVSFIISIILAEVISIPLTTIFF